MAYYNPYQQIPNQFSWPQQQMPIYQQGPAQTANTFAWVQGEAAAKAFVVQPGSTVVLMDTENPILYMKSTDMSGKPLEMQTRYLVTEEEYKRLQAEPAINVGANYATKEDLEAMFAQIEERFVLRKEYRPNAKSSV